MGTAKAALGGLTRMTQKGRAREMRREPTAAELRFWSMVRQERMLGLKFRRQHQIGPWIVDFYCHEHRLAIELVGSIHDNPEARLRDTSRQHNLEALGFHVLELLNEEILSTPDMVPEKIQRYLQTITSPSPSGGGSGRQAGGGGLAQTIPTSTELPEL